MRFDSTVRRELLVSPWLAALFCILLLVACDRPPAPVSKDVDWSGNLIPPIKGATFSMAPEHLPNSSDASIAGSQEGFYFFNGSSGRLIDQDETIIAVADGVIIRIDRYEEGAASGELEFWAGLASTDGLSGQYARDRLRGRQVWIRHADGAVSRYAHLSAVEPGLQAGDRVEQGAPIGRLGRSGVPQADDQVAVQPRLHFQLWSADGARYLGQGKSPLAIHRIVGTLFGEESLPRHAAMVIRDWEKHQGALRSYPPPEPTDLAFSAQPPDSVVSGELLLIPVSFDDEFFRSSDVFGFLDGFPLGVVETQGNVLLLGGAGLASEQEESQLLVGAISSFGTTWAGESRFPVVPRPPVPVKEEDPAVIDLMTDANVEYENQVLSAAVMASLQIRSALWSEPFRPPADGEVERMFGQRIFHGVMRPVHPLPGITVASPPDAPVYSVNSGRVFLTEDLPVRGQTVAIVHGGGVVSIYSHLSAIAVSPGDAVQRGQLIGRVGQSGATLKPLLRWEMNVAGTPTDPLHWLDQPFLGL